MPFGLSLAKMLDRAGHELELFLGEEANGGYDPLFSARTRTHFLDKKMLWERPGRVQYWLLKLYLRFITRAAHYELVISSGQVGNVLGGMLAESQRCSWIFLSDEFPETFRMQPWLDKEKESARFADLIVVPDETRFEKLAAQVGGIGSKPWVTLPNTPLQEDLNNLPEINWEEELGLPSDSAVFLQAGGIYDFNQIAESMFTAGSWVEPAVLLINGEENPFHPRSAYQHLECPKKVYWNLNRFSDNEFHSLIRHSVASFGLYRNQSDLDYVGKSSGKIMRSLGCGRPVIASDLFSLKFIEEMDLGVLVNHPSEIPEAVKRILANKEDYEKRCLLAYREHLSFERYWVDFLESCSRLGIEL